MVGRVTLIGPVPRRRISAGEGRITRRCRARMSPNIRGARGFCSPRGAFITVINVGGLAFAADRRGHYKHETSGYGERKRRLVVFYRRARHAVDAGRSIRPTDYESAGAGECRPTERTLRRDNEPAGRFANLGWLSGGWFKATIKPP